MTVPVAGCNLSIIGFSGTGKSKVAPAVAACLGFEHFDTDAEICRLAGKPVEDIFAQDGESRFRVLEKQVLQAAAKRRGTVISTGGGAVLDSDNRAAMRAAGMVVLLDARPETIVDRLKKDVEKGGAIRPLLAGADPLGRIRELKQRRLPFYDVADWTVHTDDLSPDGVVLEVVRGWRYWSHSRCGGAADEPGVAAVVATAAQSYPIWVGWGILEAIGRKMAGVGLAGKAFVISDEIVGRLFGKAITNHLEKAGYEAALLALPPGEAAKNLDSVSRIYDFLVEHRAERSDAVIALGGGVVGDTAGFAAATFNRGMRFVQIPTTLVGMVDSSIGGKVAVDHPRGKNLIGAFHQPCLVIEDLKTLATLPPREISAGYAEAVKHGLVLDAEYFEFLDSSAPDLVAMERQAVTRAVTRCVAIKADLVSRDERETLGIRSLLNYGHTIGHGIEAAAGFSRYLHGEAVAVGMVGAALLSQRMGLVGPEVVERHRSILRKLNLPVECRDVRKAEVVNAMKLDKKTSRGAIRWVLLEGIGKAVLRSDVPAGHVDAVLDELGLK